MDNTSLFTAALQLEYPWKVTNVEFLPDEDGSIWADKNGNHIECTAHDTVNRTWRHIDFFNHKCLSLCRNVL